MTNGGDEAVKQQVQQYWDGRAASYDGDSHHAIHGDEQRDAWLSILREWIGDGDPPRRILDVGCGTGVISLLLAEIGHDVTGVDLSTDMLERARAKARERDRSVEFRNGDAESISDPENAYDLVTARHLVWTLPNPLAALREWQRVVRPGGRIVLIEGHWDFDEAFDGYREIHDELPLYDGRPPGELVDVLEKHGLERVEYEPLMESVLWGEEPNYEQYVVAGDVPE
ncbi:methyltransferase domain-containing protein [Haloterrigena sp. SYSU A558-1]|uniref:Methyltransferase domain-containing protein n=1 Tax=Haloterrigena gelatinilytica TaxID=2741724 RepID=A0ABX2LCD3_9EURY|nr:class I SAM-dependent methyltransferase [Haloterrigena gelatinilytica]NUC73048.1 methyltransferase domain-containing protein [Haloterrigena gelatinilytica]